MKTRRITLILALGMLLLSAHSDILADDARIATFTKMRMDYVKGPDYDPDWERNDERKKIWDLWAADKIDEGMKLAKQWLEKVPVDAKMHLYYALFLRKKGDFRGYFKHRFIYQGLVASIASSGSGLSVDYPMKVISVDEEYSILRELGAKLIKQSVNTDKNGVSIDTMECEIEGKKITFYFDVTIAMESYEKKLINIMKNEEKASKKEKKGSH